MDWELLTYQLEGGLRLGREPRNVGAPKSFGLVGVSVLLMLRNASSS